MLYPLSEFIQHVIESFTSCDVYNNGILLYVSSTCLLNFSTSIPRVTHSLLYLSNGYFESLVGVKEKSVLSSIVPFLFNVHQFKKYENVATHVIKK